jgi:hypothetical protein
VKPWAAALTHGGVVQCFIGINRMELYLETVRHYKGYCLIGFTVELDGVMVELTG